LLLRQFMLLGERCGDMLERYGTVGCLGIQLLLAVQVEQVALEAYRRVFVLLVFAYRCLACADLGRFTLPRRASRVPLTSGVPLDGAIPRAPEPGATLMPPGPTP
jgi:hypothetical protein